MDHCIAEAKPELLGVYFDNQREVDTGLEAAKASKLYDTETTGTE